MYYLYILKLKDNSYYIGSTRDIKMRLKYHNTRKVRSTKNKLPLTLIYTEECYTQSNAQRREYKIKKWKSRKAIERLIANQSNTASSSIG